MSKKMNKNYMKRMFYYVIKYKLSLILSIIFSIFSVICMLSVPYFTGKAIDLIASSNFQVKSLISMILKLIIVIFSYAGSMFLLNLCVSYLSYNVLYDIRKDAFDRILYFPISFIDSMDEGDLTSRLTSDVEMISTGLIQGMLSLLTGIVTILATLAFMLYLNYILALVVFAITPISLFVASYIGKHSYKEFQRQSHIRGELFSITSEAITNAKLIQTLNYQEVEQEKYDTLNTELLEVGFKAQWYSALVNPCTRFVNGLVYSIIGCLGVYFIYLTNNNINTLSTYLTLGGLSCFLTYANQYTKPFNEITSIVNELQTALSQGQRVMELLQFELPVDKSNKMIDSASGEVQFNNVSFSYVKDKKLIENFNFKCKKQSKIAIVGPTGSGKTTLVNLLMRFYDCDSGTILLDGENIKDISLASYRHQFGMVLQSTWIFYGSIRDNMSYGSRNVTDAELMKVAKLTHLDYFINNSENGLDTIISNNGSISSGQKQLICISRVMLLKPTLLILDEATSNIDSLTEIQIQDSFRKLTKNKTSFVIAHRLSTIVSSDWILVMNHGNIIEQGTHVDLIKQKGFYYNLYRS